ncbi:CPBP family intramembrane glutamic endopeptidase [Proteinivorax tanatarense]|uniref:CPBP family intramembrane glutamic endopeptidase n=1 Tax=Proteinivorax tanatarense TaxID=1260629 RepID=A0AAU7VK74_9FIRM
MLFKMLGIRRYIESLIIVCCIQLIHVGIVEEFFFRVFLIGILMPLGEAEAIIISALFFGVGHIFFIKSNYGFRRMSVRFGQCITYHTSIGLILGLMWTRINSFLFIVIIHVLINGSALVYPIAKQKFFTDKKLYPKGINGLKY